MAVVVVTAIAEADAAGATARMLEAAETLATLKPTATCQRLAQMLSAVVVVVVVHRAQGLRRALKAVRQARCRCRTSNSATRTS